MVAKRRYSPPRQWPDFLPRALPRIVWRAEAPAGPEIAAIVPPAGRFLLPLDGQRSLEPVRRGNR